MRVSELKQRCMYLNNRLKDLLASNEWEELTLSKHQLNCIDSGLNEVESVEDRCNDLSPRSIAADIDINVVCNVEKQFLELLKHIGII